MTVRSALAQNRWVPRLIACTVLAGLNFLLAVLAHASWEGAAPPTVAIDGTALWCLVMAVRTEWARVSSELARKDREAAVLRTPRAPDAGPDQCPVCGLYGLDRLADDDRLMMRGDLYPQVVPWGQRRAHWACAEFVPYVGSRDEHFEPFDTDGHMTYCACPRCSRGGDGHRAYSRCTFCGFYQFGRSRDAAAEKLIAHAKVCTKRPRPTVREINTKAAELGAQISDLDTRVAAAATRVSIDSARLTEVLRMLGQGF